MANSVEVKRVGLKGKFVIDTRGIAETDATGKHDAFGTSTSGCAVSRPSRRPRRICRSCSTPNPKCSGQLGRRRGVVLRVV